MGKMLLAVGMFLLCVGGTRAQEYPRVEVFGGYSYGNFGPTAGTGEGRNSVSGWNTSANVNVNRWFGLASDIGGEYGNFHFTAPVQPIACGTTTPCTIDVKGNDKYHNFLFGPRFTLRREKVSPFGHFLIGGSHLNETATTTIPVPTPPIFPVLPNTFTIKTSSTNFAFATGGGADFKLTERMAWRVQADYLQTQINRHTQNDLRVATGLVFRF